MQFTSEAPGVAYVIDQRHLSSTWKFERCSNFPVISSFSSDLLLLEIPSNVQNQNLI